MEEEEWEDDLGALVAGHGPKDFFIKLSYSAGMLVLIAGVGIYFWVCDLSDRVSRLATKIFKKKIPAIGGEEQDAAGQTSENTRLPKNGKRD